MLIRLVVGLSMTGLVGLLAARRVFWLFRLVMSGQKVGAERTNDIKSRIETQIREVAGQAKLLKWNIPGIAHFFTMWAFFVLITVYIEAYGQMFNPHFAIPLVGHWDFLGFMQDFFITAVTLSIFVFMVIRVLRNPTEHGRSSRFYGSHNGGAWLILVMILNVVWTFLLLRGAAANTGTLPYGKGAYLSHLMGKVMAPLGLAVNENIETAALLLHVAVALGFLLIVLNSKHLHIFLAPINVTFKRLPNALGPLLPIEYQGEPLDFDNPPEDAVFGRGKIDDFTWKGMLDFATCTECGRCQSQCPAWNTGKPLSPKLVIMDLRDHWMAKAPYLLGDKPMPTGEVDLADAQPLPGHHVAEKGFERIGGSGPEQAVRPLVGTAEEGGVIDPDVLWSCTNCGACVEQCPVDIEHIDHIVDMRRYQVLVESEFPSELGVLFKNLENKGNPWGQNAKERTSWIDELNFDIPVYGQDVDSFDGFEYLFWVGCAGAYEDRAKKTTKATAELLAAAGVKFLVLGTGETCTGDPARRAGNEFLFQQLASQNVEMLNEVFDGLDRPDRKIIASCPHCFNTISREYPQLGSEYTVLHHTQVLNRLVRDKRLIPVAPVSREVTYHDPCFLGRHNKVYEPPRELVEASGANLVEMPRNRDRSFCCGAGGARMWMEEHIGKRVNHDRVDEALATGATTIATGCPFCRVMVSDGIDDRIEASGRSGVDVRDIAQLLLESLDMDSVTLPAKGTAAEAAAKAGPKKVEEKAPAPAAAAVATATAEKPAAEAKAAAPVKGLGMAGAAKRPGAKKAAPAAAPAAPAPEASAPAPAAPAAPVKGLGMAGGAKRPGAKKAAPAAVPEATAVAAPATPAAPEAPAAPAAPVKGLGMAAGARKPGAKKPAAATPAAAEPAAAAAEPASTAAEPASAASEPAPAPEAAPAEAPKEQPPVKGLGIQRGARPPGKR
ncbi:heterodisulfide reductase-related iron-sulfur binding cluster [Mycobacterium sp. SMC-14]|uniref:heterodisulfide reductase-related iron-sulfur binding cluster n=1 Tax=Mycobacterium sp. SMC-14 TaxID=3385968 RepID=UPI00390C7969